ncbi:type 1 glutamine amidotransferase domain-containing protein [Fodinicurvata sediminis]|uniref:type 1 glutamine amidotransferase domain-containing protein n=1 Tax=Fodinicurvata sediminis TaxID=1121832 RepID=UPI00047A08DF|nr:type 1 glutamine amidotransferase domain-containing protein [Fodinicurvata sediminis]
MSESTKVLFVVTSNDKLGGTGKPTGFHFEELSTPYYLLQDAGYQVEIASIQAGKAPIDPGSQKERGQNAASVERFLDDQEAMKKIDDTKAIGSVKAYDYAAIYLPGGHGTMWDLPDNKTLGHLLAEGFEQGRVIASICHGAAGLLAARLSDGAALVKGREVNCFTDSEERAVELDEVVPFLLESRLREQGANFRGADDFKPIVVKDGNLLTGQNPPSAEPLGRQLVDMLNAARNQAAE